MSPDAMAHCQDGAYALAVADPLRAAKTLFRGLMTQTAGCRAIVARFLLDELVRADPALASLRISPNPGQPGFSPGAGSGAPAVAILPTAGAALFTDPVCLPPTGSSAALTALPAGSDRPAAERSSYRRHR